MVVAASKMVPSASSLARNRFMQKKSVPIQPAAFEYKERLIAAAAKLIAEEGVQGLTAGKLASAVGLKRTVVHYHFGTIDELLAEVIRWSYRQVADTLDEKLDGRDPLDAMWAQFDFPAPSAGEFRALAVRNEVIRAAYNEVARDLSRRVAERVQAAYHNRGLTPELPAEVIVLITMMSAQYLSIEEALGGSEHHEAARSYLKSLFKLPAAD